LQTESIYINMNYILYIYIYIYTRMYLKFSGPTENIFHAYRKGISFNILWKIVDIYCWEHRRHINTTRYKIQNLLRLLHVVSPTS